MGYVKFDWWSVSGSQVSSASSPCAIKDIIKGLLRAHAT